MPHLQLHTWYNTEVVWEFLTAIGLFCVDMPLISTHSMLFSHLSRNQHKQLLAGLLPVLLCSPPLQQELPS